MTNKRGKSIKLNLRLVFILVGAGILLIAASAVLFTLYLLIDQGVIQLEDIRGGGVWIIILFVFASVVIGTIGTAIFGKLFFRDIDSIIGGLSALSEGDYSVRVNLGKSGSKKELSDKFNSLAEQLENTTILRADFINNFSHEFKTPIVSMKGLLDLLKRSDLSATKRKQYLNIIEDELDRLSIMATNILKLSKIENENLLTNVTKYNLSEQLRECILLFEKRWEKKNLGLSLEFDEFFISANEDLLKEVWINLIDNAIKFSPDNGVIGVDIAKKGNYLEVSVTNGGDRIEEGDLDKLFNKFFSKTTVSKAGGNGIGLYIVKHIVDLHKGTITVMSDAEKTTFTVVLPIE